jgi:hypothetical protein
MEGSSKPMVLLTATAAALAATVACWYLPSRPQDTLLYSILPGAGAIAFLFLVAFVTFWNMHKLNRAMRDKERTCAVCSSNLRGAPDVCPECGTPVEQPAPPAVSGAAEPANPVSGGEAPLAKSPSDAPAPASPPQSPSQAA